MKQPDKTKKLIKIIILLFLPFFAYILVHILIKYNNNTICLWKIIFKTDCWGCGITRAFHALCHLNFKSAIDYNYKIFIIIPIFIFLWLKEIIKILKKS